VSRHLLGFLVGAILTPIGLVLTAVGIGGFIAFDTALGAAAPFDVTNLSLMVVGLALLASAALLGMWSPAVPLTGGLAWGVGLGVLYIGWPALVEGWIDSAYSTRPGTLDQLVGTLNNGTWLALGVLLTAAGIATGVGRRLGRRFGERTVLATQARLEAAQAEEARRSAADAEEAARADRARALG
jgi:hypothetical protein